MLPVVWWQQGFGCLQMSSEVRAPGWLHRMCPAVPGTAGELFSWMLLQWFLIKIPWFSWINARYSKNLQQRSFSASLKDAELEKCGWADVSGFVDEFRDDLGGAGGMVCLMAQQGRARRGSWECRSWWAGAVLVCRSRTRWRFSWIFLSFWEEALQYPRACPNQLGQWNQQSSVMMHALPFAGKASVSLTFVSAHSWFLFLSSHSPFPPTHKCKFFHSRPCKQTQSTNHPSNEHLRWWRRDDCEMAAGSLAACPVLEGFGMRLPLRSAAALCPLPGRRQLQPGCREASQDLTAVLSIWGWEWRSDFPGVTGPICTWMCMPAAAACS